MTLPPVLCAGSAVTAGFPEMVGLILPSASALVSSRSSCTPSGPPHDDSTKITRNLNHNLNLNHCCVLQATHSALVYAGSYHCRFGCRHPHHHISCKFRRSRTTTLTLVLVQALLSLRVFQRWRASDPSIASAFMFQEFMHTFRASHDAQVHECFGTFRVPCIVSASTCDRRRKRTCE
jgi:hypothetical protein